MNHIQAFAGLALTLLFLSGGFCCFTGLKRMEKQTNALVQAEYSANSLARGDRPGAIRHALAALPVKADLFTPPPTAQAQYALSEALGIYDLSDGYKSSSLIELPSPPLKISTSPHGKYAAAIYAFEVALIDLESSCIIARLPVEPSALSDALFTGDGLLIYAGKDGIRAYDPSAQRELWKGKIATSITISADGKTIAAVNRDAEEAILYSISGEELSCISFEGKQLRVPVDDSFGDPGDHLLALNRDGTLLAVSFADGSLDLISVTGQKKTEILPAGDAMHFEGGFCHQYFAFSAAEIEDKCIFAVVDTAEMAQTGGFQSDHPFGVAADESGICLSSENLIVKIDPESGEQQELAYAEADVTTFSIGVETAAVAAGGGLSIFDANANRIGQYRSEYPCDFVMASGDIVLAGGRNSPDLRVFRRIDFSHADIFRYDPGYLHDEARINLADDRVTLFSYRGFRLYDRAGNLLCETVIPDSHLVYDQQYHPESGNLVVLYRDALRIYSGRTGTPLLEKTGLQSVFYAPYGVSVLERDGRLLLIDADRAQVVQSTAAEGSFAAFCGIVVDREFLKTRELIGAAYDGEDYLFAVSDGQSGSVHNGKGEELFSFDVSGKSEAFFSGGIVAVSPRHGTPAVYDIKRRKKIRDLIPDSYLSYLTRVGDWILSEYVTTSGERFGMLLNPHCEALARLPGLTDHAGGALIFDDKSGNLRRSHIYTLQELTALAREGDTAQ